MKHIERADNLAAAKSAMFEDMDNMLSQIRPIVEEMAPLRYCGCFSYMCRSS